MKLKNSAVVWEGTSQLDNQTPIVAIASGFEFTKNRKLGINTIQIGVFPQKLKPTEAIKSSLDRSVCGDCILRKQNINACYVNHGWTNNLWHSWSKGNIPQLGVQHLQQIRLYSKVLRLTSYGDPVAVPLSMLESLIEASATTLGYTHQWREAIAHQYKGICQASVHSETDAQIAQALGWKTYRIKQPHEPLLHNEVHCPHQINQMIQCQDCRLCDGKQSSIAVNVHGTKYKVNNYINGARVNNDKNQTQVKEYS